MKFLRFFIFAFIFSGLCLSKTNVFGPEKYIRETGKPQKVVKNFYVSNPSSEFELYVQNGDGKKEKSSSALIEINGEVIVEPKEFNKNVDIIVKEISLKNQNEIAVEVRSEPGSYIIVSIFGPDAPPSNLIESIKVEPQEIFIDEQKYVKINAKVKADILQYNPSLTLQRVDKYGNLISEEGNLYDDGNMENGDEAAGDGIYSLRKIFLSDIEQMIYLRICINYDSITSYSAKFNIYFLAHLTDEDIEIVKNVEDNAYQNYINLVSTIGHEGAINEVLSQLQQNPNVLQADKAESGYGIWILFSSGILGTVEFPFIEETSEGIKSNENGKKQKLINGKNEQFSKEKLGSSNEPMIEIGNRKAIVLSPFKFDFRAGQDESEKIKDTMETSHCSRFDVDYLINDQVTVEVIKGLYKYGIISIKTHGDSYFKFLNYEKWGWNFFWGQVAFSTGEQVTHENELIYEQDLKMGRLAIHKITNDRGADLGEHYLILPSFIKYYAAERYPNSLVYLSSCMSAYNYSLFHEFRNAGVKVFLGYSHDVHPSFSYDAGSTFFSNYFEWNFWSARYAFDAVPNRVDPNNSLCHFTYYGLWFGNLVKPLDESKFLKNGGFEEGILGNWILDTGFAEVVSNFGEFFPIEGSYMALFYDPYYWSTYFKIFQDICVPYNAKRLEFSWNFISEEFTELCPPYNALPLDYFEFRYGFKYGSFPFIFSRKVEGLCYNSEYPLYQTSMAFDVSGPQCEPCLKDSCVHRNDCTVWATGWKTGEIDLFPTDQKHVIEIILKDYAPYGFTKYKSALLIDDVKIITE